MNNIVKITINYESHTLSDISSSLYCYESCDCFACDNCSITDLCQGNSICTLLSKKHGNFFAKD